MDELKVIAGEGQSVPKFPADTRTSIQKRLEPKLADVMPDLKAAIASEFGEFIQVGNDAHQRRIARALCVVVAKALVEAGCEPRNVDVSGCLRADLYQAAHPEVVPAPPAPAKPSGSWLSCVGDDEGESD